MSVRNATPSIYYGNIDAQKWSLVSVNNALGTCKLKTVNNTDREILAVIHALNSFRLYLGFKEFTVRTDCEAICRYYNQINSKKSSTRRWVLFEDIITGNSYKVVFEHIKGKDNELPDLFSRSSFLQNDEEDNQLLRR